MNAGKLKQASQANNTDTVDETEVVEVTAKSSLLPWVLLGLSWLGFIGYVFFAP
ncbi:MAG: hypothetical protein ACI8WB_004681 [Phenylobacterium sp.]